MKKNESNLFSVFPKKIVAIGVIACLSCFILPMIFAGSLAGAAVLLSNELLSFGAVIVSLACIFLYIHYREKSQKIETQSDTSCGCTSYCETPSSTIDNNSKVAVGSVQSNSPPAECKLPSKDVPARLDTLRALMNTQLISLSRRDTVLELDFNIEAKEAILQLIDAERDCCGYLDFEIEETVKSVVLIIKGPAESLDILGLKKH
ncbi:MAG: hypothetical protein ACI93R_003333 [Flavobacteriales bacterium]|jgi:hypothetical protein